MPINRNRNSSRSLNSFSGMSSDGFQLPGYKNSDWSTWSTNENNNVLLSENDGSGGMDNIGAWAKFDRFSSVHSDYETMPGKHYVFMCRPDLFIFKEEGESINSAELSSESRVARDPYFTYLYGQHPWILSSLSLNFGGMGGASRDREGYRKIGSYESENHKFIPYITSRVESLQLPDYSIKSDFIMQPYSKYSIPYTTSANESTTGGSFDITFREDSKLSIHKLFYAWIYYQHGVMKNIFKPKKRYIDYNALDYATSVYDFVVDDTGENIVSWAKYTGVVPTNVPLSNFSYSRGGSIPKEVSISFSYFLCEHLDPNIMMDFNYNSLGYPFMKKYSSPSARLKLSSLKTVPIYDSMHFIGSNIVGRPIIQATTGDNGKEQFKLKWLE